IRAGSDVAFLGGLIRYVLESERWNTDSFFREFVGNYTNAATIIGEDFKDTEDLDGVFSGLMTYTGDLPAWPFNGFVGQYDNHSWHYARTRMQAGGEAACTQQSGEQTVGARDHEPMETGAMRRDPKTLGGPPFDGLVRSLLRPAPTRDSSLQDPRSVFQIVKRHFGRYTPEMVEQTTGCPKETFLKVAETILANSGRDRTTSFA